MRLGIWSYCLDFIHEMEIDVSEITPTLTLITWTNESPCSPQLRSTSSISLRITTQNVPKFHHVYVHEEYIPKWAPRLLCHQQDLYPSSPGLIRGGLNQPIGQSSYYPLDVAAPALHSDNRFMKRWSRNRRHKNHSTAEVISQRQRLQSSNHMQPRDKLSQKKTILPTNHQNLHALHVRHKRSPRPLKW